MSLHDKPPPLPFSLSLSLSLSLVVSSSAMILEINRVARTSNHVNRLMYVRNFRGRAYLALPRDQHRPRSRVARARAGGRADATVLWELLAVSYRFTA